MIDRNPTYDVAVSFAGAQREKVESIVRACERHGVTVFYDKDSAVDLWGRDFIYSMRAVYGGARARYFMPFLSEEYLAGAYPMDEFHAATRHALKIAVEDYILPVFVGPVQVPEHLLSPAIGRLRLERYSTDEFARIVAERVGVAKERHQEPRSVTEVAGRAFPARVPRLPPGDFSPHQALGSALAQVGTRFGEEACSLTPFGVHCSVRTIDMGVDVQVERLGKALCGLRLRFDDAFRDDRLLMSFAWPRITSDGFNGWVTAEWDPNAREPRFHFVELGAGQDQHVTAEDLFHLLWSKIIDHVEQTR